jgi:dolichyl-phosphate-mannose--protein O-mannosyl transferase
MVVFVHRKSSNEICREGKEKQMILLIGIMSFANFVFYPLVVGAIIAVIIEQIFRAQDKAPEILRSMAIRKYLVRQAWLFNIIWFVGYFIVMIMMRGQQTAMPDMIWQG